MDQNLIDSLYKPFELKERKGLGNKIFKYVPSNVIIDRMNKVFKGEWSSEVIESTIIEDNVLLRIKVCIKNPNSDSGPVFCHEGYGSQMMMRYSSGYNKGKIIDIGNVYKSAMAKAIKYAVTKWGVALYLDEETDNEIGNGSDKFNNTAPFLMPNGEVSVPLNNTEPAELGDNTPFLPTSNDVQAPLDRDAPSFTSGNGSGGPPNFFNPSNELSKNKTNEANVLNIPPSKKEFFNDASIDELSIPCLDDQTKNSTFSGIKFSEKSPVNTPPVFNNNTTVSSDNSFILPPMEMGNTGTVTPLTEVQKAAINHIMNVHKIQLDDLLEKSLQRTDDLPAAIDKISYKDAVKIIQYGNSIKDNI